MAILFNRDNYAAAVAAKQTMNDFIRKGRAEDVKAFITAHPEASELTPVQMAMVEAGLSTRNSRISDFYTSNGNELLFPAVVETIITEAVDENPILSALLASTITVPSKDVRTLTFDFNDATTKKKLEMKEVAEGAELPTVTIGESDKTIHIAKFGIAVRSTYESIADATVERFSLTLRQALIINAIRQKRAAIDVLLNGDGNANAAESILTTAETGKVSGSDIADALVEFIDYADMSADTLVVSKTRYKELVKLYAPSTNANVYRPGAGFTFPQCDFPTLKVLYDASMADGKLLLLNSKAALDKYVVANSVISEFDKNITSQHEIGTLSERAGFGKRNRKASALITVKTST